MLYPFNDVTHDLLTLNKNEKLLSTNRMLLRTIRAIELKTKPTPDPNNKRMPPRTMNKCFY